MADLVGDLDLDIQAALGKVNQLEQATSRALKVEPAGLDKFGAQADKARRGVKGVGDEVEKVERSTHRLSRTAKGLVGAFSAAALVRGLRAVVDVASDLEESTSKASVVFGEGFAEVEQFAEGAATAVGLAKDEALEAAGTFGNFFTAAGLSREAAAGMSTSVVQLAADLASFNNLELQDALLKLQAGLAGETEPLRRLGVNINQASVEAKALELGLADANGELTTAALLQARYALIVEQTANAQGDFARTSEGLANQQRILRAELRNAAGEIGQVLLPVALELVKAAREDLIPALQDVGPALASIVGSGGRAAISLLSALLPVVESLVPILDTLATVLGAIPPELIAGATGALLLKRGMGDLAGATDSSTGKIKNWGQAAGAIAGIAAAAVIAVDAIGSAVLRLEDALGRGVPDIDVDDLTAELTALAKGLGDRIPVDTILGDLREAFSRESLGIDGLDGLRDALDRVTDPGLVDRAQDVASGIASRFVGAKLGQTLNREAQQAREGFAALDEALVNVARSEGIEGAQRALQLVAQEFDLTGEELDRLQTVLPQFSSEVDNATLSALAAGEATGDAAEGIGDMGGEADDAVSSIDALTEALDKLVTPTLDLDEATAAFQESLDDLQETVKDTEGFSANLDILDATNVAAREVAGSFREATKDLLAQAEAAAKNGASNADMERNLRDSIQALKDQAREAGLSTQQIQDLIDRYNLFPDLIVTEIRTNFTQTGAPPGELRRSIEVTQSGDFLAAGAVVEPRPGGVSVVVGEAGSREIILPTDDLSRARQLLTIGGLGDLITPTVIVQGGGSSPLIGSLTLMEAPGFGRIDAGRVLDEVANRVFLQSIPSPEVGAANVRA